MLPVPASTAELRHPASPSDGLRALALAMLAAWPMLFTTPARAADAVTASLASTLTAQAAPAGPAAAVLSLKSEQVRSLGISTQPARAAVAGATAATAWPARLVVPPAQQRVVSAPLAGLLTGVQVAAGDVVRAGQTLASLRSGQAQELQRDAQQARSQAELAQRALARDEQLHAEGLIPTTRLDASRVALRQASLLAAERQRQLQQTGAASASGDDLSLTSPITGVVLESTVAAGQRVDGATALFRIAQLGTLWAEVQVPVAEAGQVRPGDAVRIAALGADDHAAGRVLSLGQAVDPATQTLAVRVEVKVGAGQRLRPGQLVEARIASRASTGAGVVSLAAAALVRQGEGQAVFVEQSPGQFRLVPVQVRASSAGQATVSGLPVGAQVVVQGTAALLALVKS